MAGWYVYILRCRDGSLYTGATNDLPARVTRHAAGKGARYTRSRLPVMLVYARRARDRGAALRAEAALKGHTRREKLALIAARPLARALAAAAERRRPPGRAPPTPRPPPPPWGTVLGGGAAMPTAKPGKEALCDLKEIGRKLEEVGRKLATATGRTVKNAAEETLDVADDALAAARRNLKKVRVDMKKRVAASRHPAR